MVELVERATKVKSEVPLDRLYDEIRERIARLKAAPVR
jgi:hypothetical protein